MLQKRLETEIKMLRGSAALRSLSSSSSRSAGVPLSRFDEATVNYENNSKNIDIVKARLNRPLTLSEKVTFQFLHFFWDITRSYTVAGQINVC